MSHRATRERGISVRAGLPSLSTSRPTICESDGLVRLVSREAELAIDKSDSIVGFQEY